MNVLQFGTGACRPLVAVFHAGSQALNAAAGPAACVVQLSRQTSTGYGTLDAGNPPLPELIDWAKGKTGATDFSPVVYVGFSAGCAALRAQLNAGYQPDVLLAVDGIHSSAPPNESELVAWRAAMQKARDGGPLVVATASAIDPPGYSSVRATLGAILAPVMPNWQITPGPSKDLPNRYVAGNLAVYCYPGKDAAAHIDQGGRVLPALLARVMRGGVPGWLLGLGALALGSLATAYGVSLWQ